MLPSSLKVRVSGKLLKKSSQNATKFEERYCIIAYGIFSYFRTQKKMKQFMNALTDTNDNNLSKNEHRLKFKKILNTYQPRGYIKMLDRDGNSVSKTIFYDNNCEFIINHNERQFYLKATNNDEYFNWKKNISLMYHVYIY